MTENLRLGDSKIKDRTLTSANTNLNNGLESYDLPESSRDGFKPSDDTAQNIYVVEADSGSEKKIYGGYYTWNVATANTGASVTLKGDEAPNSICPKGWRLPTGYTDGEIKALNDALGGDTHSDAHLINPDGPAFLRSGAYYDGKSVMQGSYGYYWSSTLGDNNDAFTLYFRSNLIYPASSYRFDWYRGATVRCLAE